MLLKVSSEPGIERVVPDLSLFLPAGVKSIRYKFVLTEKMNGQKTS